MLTGCSKKRETSAFNCFSIQMVLDLDEVSKALYDE